MSSEICVKWESMKNKYKYIFYAIVIVLSTFLLSGCTVSQEKIDEYNQIVADADLLIEGKEYSSAMEKLNNAAQLIPSRYDAYERMVNILITKNRLDDTKKLIDESASKLSDTDRSRLYILLGKKYYQERSYENALRNYQLSKGISDETTNVDLETAKVYLQLGNVEEAKKLLKGSLGEKFDIEGKLIFSYILSTTNIQSAKDEIADIEPDEEWKESYEGWEDILGGLTNDDLYNRAKLSKVYIDAGYPYLAITTLEPKKGNMQEYIDGLYLLGKAYYENGKYQESIDTLKGVTALSELNQYIYWTVARDYYMLNNINEAFSYYDSAVSYAGDSVESKLYQEYLDLLFENNQTTKAEEVLRKAETISQEPWVNIYYIQLSYLIGQDEKILYYSNKIEYEELEGNYKKEYLYWKSRIAIENNELDEAKRSLDLFWEIDKYNPRYNLLMSQLSFQEGKLDDSRNYAKKAIEYDTERKVTDDAQKLLARID
jgi:tetratricopeptide (TPR) repeat protein